MKPSCFLLIITSCLLIAVPGPSWAQEIGAVEGRVFLPNDDLVHRATVLLVELGLTVETDETGRYRFENVPEGMYEVLAYQSILDSESRFVAVVRGATSTLDIELRLSSLRQEITVTPQGRSESTFQAIPSVTTLNSFDLSESMATSIGEILDGQPGVAKRSFGAGNARPVVRGFDGDRVLVMQDGMRIGSLASQSGDHGEPIDAGSMERIEVVKGPATLLYGSNAVGGVVNAISTHEGFLEQPYEGLRGQISSSAGSANGQAGGSFTSEYGFGEWLLWLGGGGQRSGDYQTPIGVIANSKSRVSNGSFGLGWFGAKAFASVGYQGNDGRYGIPFANTFEGGGESEKIVDAVKVAFRQHAVRLTTGLKNLGSVVDSFELSLNYSDWNHDELEIFDDGVQEVSTTFENQQFVYKGVFTQQSNGRLSGSFGVWGLNRNFETQGAETLSPPVDQNAFAVFGLEELSFDGLRLQLGGRVEHNRYAPDPDSSLGKLDFTGVSAGVGARFDLWEGGAFVVNYTDSSRAPAMEELYNFGPHVGNLTFEIGNRTLGSERSHGLDFALRHQKARVQGEINFFYYDISDFVFLAPTGATNDGLIEAAYAQGDARYSGTEMTLDVNVHENLWINLALDTVDTELKRTSEPLPRIPPLRGTIGLDIRYGGLSVKPELVLADRRDEVFSTETETPGYGLLNLSASYTIPQAHLSHHLAFSLFNATDTLYRNHLSFIKDLAPEIGRGVRLSYSVKYF